MQVKTDDKAVLDDNPKFPVSSQMQGLLVYHIFNAHLQMVVGAGTVFAHQVVHALGIAIGYANRGGFEIELEAWTYMIKSNIEQPQLSYLKNGYYGDKTDDIGKKIREIITAL